MLDTNTMNNERIVEEVVYIRKSGVLNRERLEVLKRRADVSLLPPFCDTQLSENNEIVLDKPVDEAYEELFSKAAEEYAKKYQPKCMTAAEYFKKQENGKNRVIAFEIEIQIGTKADMVRKDKSAEIEAIKEYAASFSTRNKQMEVIGLYIHRDEKNRPPHGHLIFIPWADGYKAGMPRQISYNEAAKAQGYEYRLDIQDEDMWYISELDALEAICAAHGIRMRPLSGMSDYEQFLNFGKSNPKQCGAEGCRKLAKRDSEAPHDTQAQSEVIKTRYFRWNAVKDLGYLEVLRRCGKVPHYFSGCDSRLADSNETIIESSIEDAYEELFGKGIRDYAERHPENAFTSKQYLYEKAKYGEPFAMEATVQIGTIKETPHKADATERQNLKEYIAGFTQKNTNFKVIATYIHGDEIGKALHAHIIFIPWGEDFAITEDYQYYPMWFALSYMGYAREYNSCICWTRDQLAYIQSLCEKHGVETKGLTGMNELKQYTYFGLPSWRQMQAERTN